LQKKNIYYESRSAGRGVAVGTKFDVASRRAGGSLQPRLGKLLREDERTDGIRRAAQLLISGGDSHNVYYGALPFFDNISDVNIAKCIRPEGGARYEAVGASIRGYRLKIIDGPTFGYPEITLAGQIIPAYARMFQAHTYWDGPADSETQLWRSHMVKSIVGMLAAQMVLEKSIKRSLVGIVSMSPDFLGPISGNRSD
jgi:hypothetical protein